MSNITRDFVSQEPRTFRFKMGKYLASSLSGFVVGIVVASIIWVIGVWYFKQVQEFLPTSPASQLVAVPAK